MTTSGNRGVLLSCGVTSLLYGNVIGHTRNTGVRLNAADPLKHGGAVLLAASRWQQRPAARLLESGVRQSPPQPEKQLLFTGLFSSKKMMGRERASLTFSELIQERVHSGK